MKTADRFQQPGTDQERTEAGDRQREVERPQARSRTRTTRRIEVGFFIRKIKNGQVVYFKRFPSYGRQAVIASPQEDAAAAPEAPNRSFAASTASSGLSGTSDEPVMRPTSGNTSPGGTPGPVGGASIEVGLFLTSVTETQDDEDS